MSVLYVCEPCRDCAPETCGHDDRNELRDINGYWVCRDCFDVIPAEELGLEGDKPSWNDFHPPKEYNYE